MTIELLNIDCMEYMATLPDGAFDIAIVDPQYGRGEHGGIKRSSAVVQKSGKKIFVRDGNYDKKTWDDKPPDPTYFVELRRVAKQQIIFGVNYFEANFRGGRIVWDKINDGADQSGCEIAYNSLNERVDIVRYMWRGMLQGEIVGSTRAQGNKSLNEARIHPTQKPVKLYDWLFRTYVKTGQTILDTHLGSASSAIAAYRLGLDFVGCEIDTDYYAAAAERFENETRQQALAL